MRSGARLVLLSLANHANDSWLSWPAVQTMAREARMSRRNVQYALRELQKAGEIEPAGPVSQGGRRSTTYLLSRFRASCMNVGPPTTETPYGNRDENVGFRHENATADPKNSLRGAAHCTPPAQSLRPTRAAHCAPPAQSLRPSSATLAPLFAGFCAPPAQPLRPRGAAHCTRSFIEPSRNHQIQEPPLPPASGGHNHTGTETVILNWAGGIVYVEKPRYARLWTKQEAAAAHGLHPIYVVELFRAKGWNAWEGTNG